MRLLKKLLVATTPKGAAALLEGGGTFPSLRELDEWYRHGSRRPLPRRRADTSAAAGSSSPGLSTTRAKRVLMGLIVVGALSNLGSTGSFASFSAEVENTNSSIASGTLTMNNQVESGTVCLSANGTSQTNVNPACSSVLALTNVAPGVFGGTAKVTIQNTGSLDASKFYLYAPYVNSTTTAALTSGTSVGSLTVAALEGTVTSGDSIVLTYGTHTQTFVANAGASGGATSIGVTAQNANFSYPVGTIVTDTSSNTTVNNTDCYDAKTTAGGTAGSTKGTDLNFNPIAGNPFCGEVLMYVQETGTNTNYCWAGNGAGTAQCTAPVSTLINGTLSTGSPITLLPVQGINGNVKSGDQIVVTSGSNTQTFQASGPAYFTNGNTTIPINSATPNFAYPNTSTVVNSSALSTLNIDSTNTISNFDTGHPFTGKIQLYPTTANGSINNTATVELAHFNTGNYQRTFQVGLYFPAPAGQNQNQYQGLASTFGLTWHIDQ